MREEESKGGRRDWRAEGWLVGRAGSGRGAHAGRVSLARSPEPRLHASAEAARGPSYFFLGIQQLMPISVKINLLLNFPKDSTNRAQRQDSRPRVRVVVEIWPGCLNRAFTHDIGRPHSNCPHASLQSR